MSKIDDQIKTLQLRKKKIQFLKHILSSTKSYRDKDLDQKASKEVIASLSKFVDDQISIIESGKEVIQLKGEFSEKELNALRTVASKVLQKGVTTGRQSGSVQNESNPPKPPGPQKRTETVDTPDKLSFALENRHLAGKRVTIANDQNMTVIGEVVGLDAPNVIVKTDTGPTIQVPLGNVSLT